jgi:hypothetical protein
MQAVLLNRFYFVYNAGSVIFNSYEANRCFQARTVYISCLDLTCRFLLLSEMELSANRSHNKLGRFRLLFLTARHFYL